MVGSPGTLASDWSAVQALLERNGIGSVAVVPPSNAWLDVLRGAADSLLNAWGPQRRPLVVLTFGTALDSVLLAAPVGHALRTRRVAVVAAGRPRVSRLQKWISRLTATFRPAADLRLAAWSAPVMVLRALDDDGFDSPDAVRLAAGAAEARLGVLPGGGFSSAPQHPADDAWREVIEFVLGRVRYHDAVVQPDSVMTRNTVLKLPASVPIRTTPSAQSPH